MKQSEFDDLLMKVYDDSFRDRSRIISDPFIFSDGRYSNSGVVIEYINRKKKKIRITINPSLLMQHDDSDGLWEPSKENSLSFINKLKDLLDKRFDNEFELDDFSLNELTLTMDVDLEDRDLVKSYIRTLNNMKNVKNYTWLRGIKAYREEYKHLGFILQGNSNGVTFAGHSKALGLSHFENEKACDCIRLRHHKNVLRFDIVLEKVAVRRNTKHSKPTAQIIELAKNREKIFVDIFYHIIPMGDYLKLTDAVKVVERRVSDIRLQRKMINYMKLIPTTKSVLSAQQSLGERKIEKIKKEFAMLGLSPITITKRQDVKHLRCLYKIIAGDKSKDIIDISDDEELED